MQFFNVVFTGILVVVTGIYVYLTWRISKLTGAQLELAGNQMVAQERASEREGFLRIVDLMEQTRLDRAFIRDCVRRRIAWQQLTPAELDRVDAVCRSFDVLALLHRLGFVRPDLVDHFYSCAFVMLYDEYLGTYVEDLRKPENRGPTHYWELVEFYKRVKDMPQKHPAIKHP